VKEGIALLAHGSRDPQWSAPFQRLAAKLQEKLPAVAVSLAYLEHGPSLDEALAALHAKGAASIRVVPVFLGSGGHVKSDLPRLVREAAAAFPAQKLVLEKPIGEQERVIEAIAAAISSAGSV
jgi:sirohydrochlorin cobaltochelatase